jgi:hypothetical protein
VRSANRFNWRLPLYGFVGAVIVVLPTTIFGNDVGTFLETGLIAAIIGLIVIAIVFRTMRRQSMAALSMVAVFGSGCWVLFDVAYDVHTTGRWLIQSGKYKAEVLAQPNSTNGELKHVEWDGWGFAGADTVEFLVFDPNDSLVAAARSRAPGKYSGIPCEVPSVRRLEKQWYTVEFYTDTYWDQCKSN